MRISLILIGSIASATDYVNKLHLGTGRHGLRGLPAQESGDFQLVFLRGIMHRSLSSMRVQALMTLPFCVVRDRIARIT